MSAESKATPDRRPSADEAKAFTLAPITPVAFGKYVLIGKLGHGGMAEVNLAVTGGQGGFRKLFVVKRLHAHLETEPGFVDMFLDEARLAAQLDHPNCVQTVEVGEANGQHFLAMSHLDGQGLERLLRVASSRAELIPPPLAARIAADALEGLGYAHELAGYDGAPLNVVHRDISPQNLFITYTGIVKVLDFGIAKAATNVVETRTGVVKGKYAYIAPEQALATPIDQRADLWSMGVVFWELLTARRLFKSVNELATLQETLQGHIRKPSEVVAGIPPELDQIVMRALQRDVSLRHPTAAAFRLDIERYLATVTTPCDRRALGVLMTERFGEIIDIHKKKLRDCLEAVSRDEGNIARLVAEGMTSSAEGTYTPAAVGLPASDGGTYTPSGIGPTPLATRGATLEPVSSAHTLPARPPRAPARGAPTPITDEPADETIRVPPRAFGRGAPPRERPRSRRLGLWLVGLGALLVAGVALTLAFGPALSMETLSFAAPEAAAPVAVTARVVGGAAEPIAHVPDVATPEVELAPEVEVAPRSGSGHRSSRRGERTPAAAAEPSVPTATAPAVEASTTPPASDESGDGFLALVTSPWTTVTWNGTSLGTTPLTRVRMPAGHHTLRLVNEAEGVSETYEVDIRPGEVTRARLGLR